MNLVAYLLAYQATQVFVVVFMRCLSSANCLLIHVLLTFVNVSLKLMQIER